MRARIAPATAVAALLLLFHAAALAAAPAAEQPAVEKKLSEVVKGAYLEAEMGYARSLASDVPSIGNGMTLSVLAGYDIKDIVAIEGGYTGMFVWGTRPGTFQPGSAVPGDFGMHMITVDCKVSYLSTEKWFFYVRVGGGVSINAPSRAYRNGTSGVETMEIAPAAPLALAAAGAEYYTGIRHFSLGIEVKTHILPTIGTYLLAFQPYMKYTF